jgi:hypothetical protein
LPGELTPIISCFNDLLARLKQSFEREPIFSEDLVHELPTPIAESALKRPEAREPQADCEVLTIATQMEGRTNTLSPGDPEFKIKTMSLRNELENSGSWLFRHRSYLPLLIVPIFLVGLSSFTYLSQSHAINELWQFLCLLVSFLARLGGFEGVERRKRLKINARVF